MVNFGRAECGNPAISTQKEWLVTNGLGGYAMGTVAGPLTRRYHGLLVAALRPPVSRALLISKFDETVTYNGETYALFSNHWGSHPPLPLGDGRGEGVIEPRGFEYIENFRLEFGVPVWVFRLADAELEKRLWMEHGENTTYVQYTLKHASAPLKLSLKVLANDRDHHANTQPHLIEVTQVENGLKLSLPETGAQVWVLSDRAQATPRGEWYKNYFLAVEAGRGLDALDCNFYAGDFVAELQPHETITVIITTVGAHRDAPLHEPTRPQNLIKQSRLESAPPEIQQLVLAADQFIVKRQMADGTRGDTVIAGYPWFTDWGRDTMIALPGLTLATRRFDVAANILRTFAKFVSEGMLPNYYPDADAQPEYNTVDATLWYFEAVRAYYAATHDDALLRELWPTLTDIVAGHERGTRYQIHVDESDGLLYAGEAGVQLTWMDVKIDEWVVTPRTGKPVEINALWFNALRAMADFARRLGHAPERFEQLAERVQASFHKLWNAERGYCFDVIGGPTGDEATLRPNQLFAVSLAHSPLTPAQQSGVVVACAQHLLTSHGLRTLPPSDPNYHPHYNGDRVTRDTAYHQGTVWPWLMGPFVSAHFRVFKNKAAVRSFFDPLLTHLNDHGLGTISEVCEADPPHTPHACIAQAWSVAEVLRVWIETQ
jgi:predicted glycogen debranching enzyme